MRGDARGRDPGSVHRIVGSKENASFQVIILVRRTRKEKTWTRCTRSAQLDGSRICSNSPCVEFRPAFAALFVFLFRIGPLHTILIVRQYRDPVADREKTTSPGCSSARLKQNGAKVRSSLWMQEHICPVSSGSSSMTCQHIRRRLRLQTTASY
jgi:hypothetical protein